MEYYNEILTLAILWVEQKIMLSEINQLRKDVHGLTHVESINVDLIQAENRPVVPGTRDN